MRAGPQGWQERRARSITGSKIRFAEVSHTYQPARGRAGGIYDAMLAGVLTVAVVGFLADRLYLVLMAPALAWRE